jgi:N-acetylneuraminic acid mutarotase
MLVVGGGCREQRSCERATAYDPKTDTWSPLPEGSGLGLRTGNTAVAGDGNGSIAFFWGGERRMQAGLYTDEGAAYDAKAGGWIVLPSPKQVLPNAARRDATSWFAAGRFYVWGGLFGQDGEGGFVKSKDRADTGAAFDMTTKAWQPMPTMNAPTPRSGATAVWTGSEAIVWGGLSPHNASEAVGALDTNDGKRFRP